MKQFSADLNEIEEKMKMNVDPKDANVLLNQKYDKSEEGREVPQLKKYVTLPSTTEESKYWKMIAEERLEVMNQLRDQMNAWWEAYKVEKLRGDRFEALYLDEIGKDVSTGAPENEPQEVKHTVNTRDQFNTRRARWPEIKRTQESLHRDFGEVGAAKENELPEVELKDLGREISPLKRNL